MEQRKAKRKLSSIDFSRSDSHMALVHKDQGGPASGADYKLVLKANNFSQEFITRMQQVRVTMELPDFLRKFFNIYYEDSEILARMMGYVPDEKSEDESFDYEDYISSKLESFEILKAVNDAESIADVLSGLDETQYLALLNDQSLIEKALKKIDKQPQITSEKKESEEVAKATESDTSHIVHEVSEGKTSVITNKSKEKHMTKPVKTETQEVTVEMVEKSAFVDLQKSLEDQKQELQKALDTIAVFQKEKQELINKSKAAQFTAVIKDEKLHAPIVKAALELESAEDYDAFLAAITAMQVSADKSKETLEKSALFQEQGATVSEDNKPAESALARVLKAKQAKQ
jgi:hypothetical protein